MAPSSDDRHYSGPLDEFAALAHADLQVQSGFQRRVTDACSIRTRGTSHLALN